MGSGSGFDAASKYSADSIEKCRQLTAFLKKRQALEEEYARGLSKPNCENIPEFFRKTMQVSLSGTDAKGN